MPTTWNPADKSTSIALSGGNLIAANTTSGGSFEAVRATTFKARTFNLYWELTILAITGTFSSNGSFVGGLCNATQQITGNIVLGASANGYGYYPWSGLSFVNGSAGSIQVDQTVGHVISLAWRGVDNTFFTRAQGGNWNNNGSANPATNTGGVSIAALTGTPLAPCFFSTQGGSVQANFGASAFAFAKPAGFTAFDAPATTGGIFAAM